MGSGRYYGFVIGGTLPSSLAADWLVSAWDQNTGLAQVTPATSALEAVTGRWVLELLGLPAALLLRLRDRLPDGARHGARGCAACALRPDRLRPPERGLAGAPPLRVVVGAKRHVTLTRALRLARHRGRAGASSRSTTRAGCGSSCSATSSPADDAPTIVCVQAGEVNTGSFDDLETAIAVAHDRGAWVHVDGAFGLWAATSPALAHLVRGQRRRGLVGDRRAQVAQRPLRLRHRDLRASADARGGDGIRGAVPRRRDRRGARSDGLQPRVLPPRPLDPRLGRDPRPRPPGGDRDDRVELRLGARDRRRARRAAGLQILNDVVLNQVLLRFEDDERTSAIVAAVQREGEAWMGRPSGTAAPRSGSRSRAGARTRTTSAARSRRSNGQRLAQLTTACAINAILLSSVPADRR